MEEEKEKQGQQEVTEIMLQADIIFRKHQSFQSMEGIAGQDIGNQLSLVQIKLSKGP